MAHLLHIDFNPRGDRSVSRSLTDAFMAEWRTKHPDDIVTYRDVGQNSDGR